MKGMINEPRSQISLKENLLLIEWASGGSLLNKLLATTTRQFIKQANSHNYKAVY